MKKIKKSLVGWIQKEFSIRDVMYYDGENLNVHGVFKSKSIGEHYCGKTKKIKITIEEIHPKTRGVR